MSSADMLRISLFLKKSGNNEIISIKCHENIEFSESTC